MNDNDNDKPITARFQPPAEGGHPIGELKPAKSVTNPYKFLASSGIFDKSTAKMLNTKGILRDVERELRINRWRKTRGHDKNNEGGHQ